MNTTKRTYTKAAWDAAQQTWADGEFSDEWKPWRHEAAMVAGIIFPPDGTKWDSWEDEEPSDRAQLIRAIRETPALLRAAIRKSVTWKQVVFNLDRNRETMREEAMEAEEEFVRAASARRVGYHEAVTSIKAIVDRIAGS
jgi:hypothetical protein